MHVMEVQAFLLWEAWLDCGHRGLNLAPFGCKPDTPITILHRIVYLPPPENHTGFYYTHPVWKHPHSLLRSNNIISCGALLHQTWIPLYYRGSFCLGRFCQKNQDEKCPNSFAPALRISVTMNPAIIRYLILLESFLSWQQGGPTCTNQELRFYNLSQKHKEDLSLSVFFKGRRLQKVETLNQTLALS